MIQNEKHKPITSDETTTKEMPLLFGKGILMGFADVIPGVSGGTIALIAGIYERFLAAIKSFDKDAITHILAFRIKSFFEHIHWKFLIALLFGIQVAILVASKVLKLPVLIHTQPEPIYGLFFGLILGSIFVLVKKIQPFSWNIGFGLILGTAIGFTVVNLVPTDTPEDLPFVFLYGMISIIAMILPGISGSFILLILGKYDFILGNIALLGTEETISALIVMGVFASGSLVGIATFSRFLSWLLNKFYKLTMAVLIGFLIGSLWVIWPWQERDYEEIVSKKIELSAQPELVQELLKQPQNPESPEFMRLSFESGNPVHIEKVKRKLIHSTPVGIPNDAGFMDLHLPWIFMILGAIGVFFIESKARSKD